MWCWSSSEDEFLLVIMILGFLVMIVCVLQSVAFVTLVERHYLGGSQVRLGPNKVSFMGLFQAIFDGIKLIKKEQFGSSGSSEVYFYLIPGVSFVIMNLEWFVLSYVYDFLTFEYSFLFLMSLVGFMVYAIMLSGVVSKSKYGIIGALRAVSQSVSYEITFGLFLIVVVLNSGMVSFDGFKYYSYLILMFVVVPFLISVLAELNRAPFDFSEGESELVSGYNVEYGSVSFVLLFLSEYGSLLFFSVLISLLFFMGSLVVTYVLFCLLILIRSSYPRYRYDYMMGFFWFKLLPISLILFVFMVSLSLV